MKCLRLPAVLLAAVLLFCSCAGESKKKQSFFAMDTVVDVTIYGGIPEMFADIEMIVTAAEDRYSATKPDSLVSVLNSGGALLQNDEGLILMLQKAEELRALTNGAYNIAIAPIMKLYGFGGGEHRIPSDEEIENALSAINSSGRQIDLGSCAKGYTADLVVEYLENCGVCAVLSLGGSVHTVGKKPDGKKFNIGIADPKEPTQNAAYIEVGECAIVTSGTYQRYFEENGVRYHHLIDGRTGRPSDSNIESVTVIIENSVSNAGLKADLLSTALFLMGSEWTMDYYNSVGGFEAVMILKNGEILTTDKISENIRIM